MTNKLSAFLKKIRSTRNLSLRELARLTSVSYSYLSALERGFDARSQKPMSPTIEVVIKIAQGLNIPLGTFLINAGFADNDYISHGDPSALITQQCLVEALAEYLVARNPGPLSTDEIDALKSYAAQWWEKHYLPDTKPLHFADREKFSGSPGASGTLLYTSYAMASVICENTTSYPLWPVSAPEKSFGLQMVDDTMEPTLASGSPVIFRTTTDFENGDICAVVAGEHPVIKRVYRYNDKIELVPDNPKFPRKVYPRENIRILGVMEYEIRHYHKPIC